MWIRIINDFNISCTILDLYWGYYNSLFYKFVNLTVKMIEKYLQQYLKIKVLQ